MDAEKSSPVAQPAPDPFDLLKAAVALHQARQFAAAEATYLRILEIEPGYTHAQRLLGILCHQQGRHAAALGLIDSAIRGNPEDAEAHGNRGNVLLTLKRHMEAL